MTKVITEVLVSAAVFTACVNMNAQSIPVYQDYTKGVEERVEDALARLTLEEKVSLLHADRSYGSAGVPRLGLSENNLTDGPSGLRPEMVWQTWIHAGYPSDSCTAYPALECLAATWNPEMGHLFGSSYSEEALYRNKNMILGPAVNIIRTPMNGRTFEYMGEDPYLAGQMAVSYIHGVQGNNVSACVKHFAVNNQEHQRTTINTLVDERTLNEIYFPAFKTAVQEGGVWAVMGAYNKFEGQYCCHNKYLLQDVLKDRWGFDGVVVSDFGGTHDTMEAIENGLDLEMGTDLGSVEAYRRYKLADPYLKLLREGKASEEVLNDKVRRVLRMMFRTSMAPGRPWGTLASGQHAIDSRKIAEEGMVLLKNNGILPLDSAGKRKILVVGENADKMMSRYGGSSETAAKYEVTPLEGILGVLGDDADVSWTRGYSSKDTDRLADSLRNCAVAKAKEADVVIYIGGMNKDLYQDCEGVDRQSYNLPYNQDALIAELAGANPSIVAVMVCGNAYAMPWVNDVAAILHTWYGGTEAGNAVASILFGKVNPSGKLPFTFPVRIEDTPAYAYGAEAYPGDGETVEYKEGIFVGYRWYEHKKIKPQFAFGYGLSYTVFGYDGISLDRKSMTSDDTLNISVTVTNKGEVAGSEVVQLYVEDVKSSLPRPKKELKRFAKVSLLPGESKVVNFSLSSEDLSYYDPAVHGWVAEPGKFKVHVAASSDDVRETASFELK